VRIHFITKQNGEGGESREILFCAWRFRAAVAFVVRWSGGIKPIYFKRHHFGGELHLWRFRAGFGVRPLPCQ